MSEEVKAAVELVRLGMWDGHLVVQPGELERAERLLAQLYASTNRADDETVIDAAWLSEISGECIDDEGVYRFVSRYGQEVFFWLNELTLNFNDPEIQTPCRTRGEFRAIIRAICLLVKEPNP